MSSASYDIGYSQVLSGVGCYQPDIFYSTMEFCLERTLLHKTLQPTSNIFEFLLYNLQSILSHFVSISFLFPNGLQSPLLGLHFSFRHPQHFDIDFSFEKKLEIKGSQIWTVAGIKTWVLICQKSQFKILAICSVFYWKYSSHTVNPLTQWYFTGDWVTQRKSDHLVVANSSLISWQFISKYFHWIYSVVLILNFLNLKAVYLWHTRNPTWTN